MIKKLIFIVIIFFIGFACGWHCKEAHYEYIYVRSAMQEPNINDPLLMNAIIHVESKGNHKAVSSKGAYGLMQVRYKPWKKDLKQFGIYSHKDLFNPIKNKQAGQYILNWHYQQVNGDLQKALCNYSGGAKFYFERVMFHYLKNL